MLRVSGNAIAVRFCISGFRFSFCLLLLLAFSAPISARSIELQDYEKLVGVADPQISPDGKSIVVVVSHVNMKEDRRDNELVLIDIASGEQRVLTFDRLKASSPRWSPTGDRLAFLSETGTKEKAHPQLFVMSMQGGEAKPITDAPMGVEQFAWRPNGRDIAFVTPDEPADPEAIKRHEDAFEVGNNDFLVTVEPTPSHIWLIPAEGGKARRLTKGSWSLPKTQPPSSPASPINFSPDGKYLTFTHRASPFTGDASHSFVEVLDVESGHVRKLTSHELSEGYGEFSPDGSEIAYWFPRDGDPPNDNAIYVTAAGGGDGHDVSRAIDRDLFRAIWLPDGKSLLVGGHDGTRVALWRQPLVGQPAQLKLGDVNPSWSFWIDMNVGHDGAIAFTGSEPHRPTELYYMKSWEATPRRLTNFNHEVAALDQGAVENFDWQGPDEFKEDAVVVYPPGFNRSKKYPLVLLIHGGPKAASTINFGFQAQLIASHGYVVFQPNYRGSDNLGNAYRRAIFRDAGDGPGRDVMAGVEAFEKRGFIDTARIGVSGWSYGGYMTSWLIGHYHIWKAAVSGAAVNNLVDQYDLADFNVGGRFSWGPSPWVGDGMKGYRDQSPITYAAQIKTPTLILSDTGDFRVPVTQSYEMFHALRDNGVTTKFFAYPVRGHFPSDPVRQMDVYRRWLAWLDEYLK
ncbi:MAG: S9 family peptidase [Acidobacteriia bacterium]|nr:S9 family peptidase [Terriglobia bacterium]